MALCVYVRSCLRFTFDAAHIKAKLWEKLASPLCVHKLSYEKNHTRQVEVFKVYSDQRRLFSRGNYSMQRKF